MTENTLPYRVRTRAARPTPQAAASSSPPDQPSRATAATPSEPTLMDSETPIAATAYVRSPEQPASKPVGYKNPPEEHRFKPGQRANPRGRPKGSKNIRTLAHETFYAKVKVREGGRTRQMSKGQIGMTKSPSRNSCVSCQTSREEHDGGGVEEGPG
jgi:hypothetical protein